MSCGEVPDGWKRVKLIPSYQNQGNSGECKRRISWLKVVEKVHVWFITKRVLRIISGTAKEDNGGDTEQTVSGNIFPFR